MRSFVLLFAFMALLSVSRADIDSLINSAISEANNAGNVLTSAFDDDFPGITSIAWSDVSKIFDDASDLPTWGNSIHSKASHWIHNHHNSSITKTSPESGTPSAQTDDVVPTDEAFSPSGIPSNAPEGEPLGAPNTQSITSTFSTDGALASLMHYKSNDQLVGIFCLFIAGLAGAGAILL